tara:strand:+ start:988 stop:1899 length:912 start_codon:yes stop_codon:yes gene_type:complete
MFSSSHITVIGAGLMGCGIAQVFASKAIQVTLYDPIEGARQTVKQKIAANLTALSQSLSALDFVHISDNLETAVANANFVIEAAPEKLPLKRKIFTDILRFARPDAILASNTSVIPIKDIFEGMDCNERIVGCHWWNPPYLVPLVEVVQSEQSSLATVESMMSLLAFAGKKPVHIQKDVPGFVGNRMQHALWREAIALINDGVCTAEGIDTVVKNSFGLRMPVLGPIENADLVGLDLTLDIHNVILASINRDTVPSDILKSKVEKGELGIKTGQGFKHWTDESAQTLRENLSKYLVNSVNSKG